MNRIILINIPGNSPFSLIITYDDDGIRSKIDINIIILSENDKQNVIKELIFSFFIIINVKKLPITVDNPAIKDNKRGPIISI